MPSGKKKEEAAEDPPEAPADPTPPEEHEHHHHHGPYRARAKVDNILGLEVNSGDDIEVDTLQELEDYYKGGWIVYPKDITAAEKKVWAKLQGNEEFRP